MTKTFVHSMKELLHSTRKTRGSITLQLAMGQLRVVVVKIVNNFRALPCLGLCVTLGNFMTRLLLNLWHCITGCH